MRKIKSQKQIEKGQKRNQLILALIFISLLVASTAGYSFSSKERNDDEELETQNYTGLTFTKQNNYWLTTLDNQQYMFNNLPNELTQVKMNFTITLANYSNRPLYIVNPNQNKDLLLSNLNHFFQRYQEASLEQTEKDIPIKNCSIDNIIIFKESNETKITQNENCIYLEGNQSEAVDKFIYTLFGIIY